MKIEDFKVDKEYTFPGYDAYVSVKESNGQLLIRGKTARGYGFWQPSLNDIKRNDWEEDGEDERIVKIKDFIKNSLKLFSLTSVIPPSTLYEKGILDTLSCISNILNGE
jgi:hypothetical protein